ncbi:hypothetical protein FB451DRAFT_1220768 [Mycena latifolia]|nr:hypothetical protein FB451DRAFT_1220768 [Mycena latifolia]
MAVGTPGVANSILLVASWLNIGLYTMELVLCRRYFRNSSRRLIHKIGVGAMVLFDTLCTLATCFEVQLSLIVFPDNLDSVVLLKPLAALLYTTYAAALVEQYFLCNLYFLLTKNSLVTGFLALCVLTHTGFSYASATIVLAKQSVFPAFLTTLIGAITCAATDILIAFCLCLKFWQMMTRCSPEAPTRSLVQRIMVMTISSGAIVALNTLIMMILLLKGSPVFQLFFTCQGRVYSLTLLRNFLLGTPFNPSSNTVGIETNPSSRVGTNLVFRVNAPDSPPRAARSRNSAPLENSSNYYEERIDLKTIPSLSRKPSSSA